LASHATIRKENENKGLYKNCALLPLALELKLEEIETQVDAKSLESAFQVIK
jgi:hypothetical protein